MPIDAYRQGDRFVVHFDLPGVDPASVDLTVEKNVLTVHAERSWRPGEGVELVVSERPQGTFTRQLFLGETLDTDRIEANYDQGVLTVTIPTAVLACRAGPSCAPFARQICMAGRPEPGHLTD